MKKILIFLFLIVSVVWAGKGIFKYSVYYTHDGDHHLARSYDAIETIKEGHFPLRWAGSLNYSCGVPIYNFFYPLLYYLVIIFNFFLNNVILSLKIINFLALIIGTIFFYLWIKSETGKEIPAIASAFMYLYAPYRFLLIFVRGSPEYLAYAILPVVLYFYSLFFKAGEKKYFFWGFLSALSGGLLSISHNFTVLFLMPIVLTYLIVKVLLTKPDKRKLYVLVFSYLSAFGFGAFFIGPAVLEKNFTKIGDNFLMWRDHFPTLSQLIKSKWDYFYSSSGTVNDGMSFMLGYAHWAVLGLALLFIIYRLIKKKFDPWVIIFFAGSLFTLYLILPWSVPVWEKFPILQEIQFSWRLLGVAVFTISALFAFILDKIESKYILITLFVGISLLAYLGNRNHLLPQPVAKEDLYRYDNFEKLHPHRFSTTTLGDDAISKGADKSCWFTTPILATDKEDPINSEIVERKNTHGSVKVLVNASELKSEKTVLGLGYFPKIYHIFINGRELEDYSDCKGKVCFDSGNLRQGENFISWKVTQSPIENLFNFVTLGFLLLWAILFLKKKWALILGIFVIFLFFRFYNLDHRIGFNWDQERDAWAVSSILSGDLKLIGPRVLGPSGFFLPPYFFYILAPFYILTGFHPSAVIYFLLAYSIAFFVTSFLIIRKIFSEKVGLIFLMLWAVNPLAISIDTVGWNPNLIPLVFLLYLYAVIKKRSFLSGFLLGVGTSFHFQFLLLSPALFGVIDAKKRTQSVLKVLIAFVLPFAPLFLFDLRHNFLNARLLLDFASGSGKRGYLAFLPVWDKVSSFAFGLEVFLGVGLISYVVLSFILFKLSKYREIFLAWIVFPIFFALYGTRPSEYYFNYLLPIVILALALFFASFISKSKLGILILVSILVFWSIRAIPLTRTNRLSLYFKDKTAFSLSEITKNGSPFNISYDTSLNEDAGFRYLFKYYKIYPSGKDEDPLIEVVVPKDKRKNLFFISGLVGLSIPQSWLDKNWVASKK